MSITRHNQKGFTLLEIIVTLVILSISLGAIINAYSAISRNNSDPVLIQQSVSIAQSYMEEITLLPFNDPDGSDGEANRALFDDVDDYNGLTTNGATDNTNTNINGLEAYNVAVVVTSINSGTTLQIRITVSHPAIPDYQLIGIRMDY